jgi:hypothetical protein
MTDSTGTSTLLTLPYYRRQLIMVVDDAVAKQVAAAAESPSNKPEVWQSVLGAAKTGALSGVFLTPALIELAIKAVRNLKERGIKVLTVGHTEAGAVTFPPGHPRGNVLYIGHPAKPQVYYTAAQFHRVTFEHKFSEAIRLLMCLGAVEIRVEFVRGWKRDFASQLSIPLSPAQSVGASASASVGKQSQENLLFQATLSKGRHEAIPDDLIWYHHEPTWQNIADGRLNHGLMDFSLTVSYEDDFGINLGLTASAQRAGMELGGKFEDHQNTVWQIVGKFGPSTP